MERSTLAVCEVPCDLAPGTEAWLGLAATIRQMAPEFVLLGEMPFGRWLAAAAAPNHEQLQESIQVHDAAATHFTALNVSVVLGSRPVLENGNAINQAFAWTAEHGAIPVHSKQFFPDERDFFEARWFRRGQQRFQLLDVDGLKIGFLICTEVMFTEWARFYGRQGAHLLVVPRATEKAFAGRWQTAIAMAAIASGCYVASSNRAGIDRHGIEFGGGAWIFDPDGTLLAEATGPGAAAAVEIDRVVAERAKSSYPRYVPELPDYEQ